MGGLAIGVGFGLGYLVDRPAWWEANAILDADFANSRFRWDWQTFGSEASFLAAIGGVGAGGVRTIGPYVAPSAAELVVNGNFDTDLAGWTSVLNGTSSAAVISQAARLTSDGTTGIGLGGAGIIQSFATVLDRAYRLLYTVLPSLTPSVAVGNALYANNSFSATRAPGATYTDTFSADGATSHLYYFRGAAGGAVNVDSVSVKECLPFKNFDPSGLTVEIQATVPASAVLKPLFSVYSAGPNDEANIRLSGTGHLIVQANYGAATVGVIDLGLVASGQNIKVRAGWRKDAFYGQLNDGPILSDTSGGFPGVGVMRIGSDSQSAVWDAAIARVTVWGGGGLSQFLGEIDDLIHAEGDSFMGGAYGVVLPSGLNTLMARTVYNTGVGGNSLDQISARLISAPAEVRSKTTVMWDGDHNGFTTLSAYCDLMAAALTALGHHRFVVIPPCVNYGQANVSVEAAIRDEFVARWPNNVLDWRNVLTLDGNGVPVASMYYDSGTDTTHLSQAAMDLMAPAIKNFIEARGW
ncbi:hypothetical protein [Devosia sp. CN2-171]|uniref:hypothetical protein n=1 Tax=Devosia sp. CN2-171 TaxID=3400909 RepID=UPI003BF7C67F